VPPIFRDKTRSHATASRRRSGGGGMGVVCSMFYIMNGWLSGSGFASPIHGSA